jgi:hypothetical protein
VVLADGYRHIVVACAQGPVVRVIGEDDVADAELVDQVCCTGRAGHLAGTGVSAAQFAYAAGESRMERAARCGRIWSSRT